MIHNYRYHKKFPKYLVFPLIKRLFWNMSLLSPRMPSSILQMTYNVDVCVSESRNLNRGDSILHGLDCQLLADLHPFVYRVNKPDDEVEEILRHGEQVLFRRRILPRDTPASWSTYCMAVAMGNMMGLFLQ